METDFHINMVDVSKSFGTNEVLNNFNLKVKKGEFLTILGPSGCGKTTTLNLLAGFLFPDKGEIWIGEKEVSKIPPYERNVSMVFQNYALFPHMNVYDNVSFGLKIRKIDKMVTNQLFLFITTMLTSRKF